VTSIIRKSPDDANWQPWFFLAVAVMALALVVSVAAVTSAACGGDGGGTPASPTDLPTSDAETETPSATSTATPTNPASATATATPTTDPTEEPTSDGSGDGNGGGEYVDNSPYVGCSISAPLSQNTQVERDCVIGPLVNVEGYLLNESAAAAYLDMKAAAAADGIDIFIISAYRDWDTQFILYQNEVAAYGPDQNTSAKPGHSEHQLGTTVDLNDLSPSFGDTPAGQWLQQNAGRFGFRMSYPAGMEASTGYAYEPWHWRWWG
jgi:D-alanyl-D-alanine carboxypeptidase